MIRRGIGYASGVETPEGETRAAQLARNWNELLQELRVTQTGVQVLTGFLLTVPFSNRFDELDQLQRAIYLTVLSGSVIATGLLLTPAACHRLLFRQGARPWLLEVANKIALAGLTTVALTTAGVVFLAFDLVAGRPWGLAAAIVALVAYVSLWVVLPYRSPVRSALDER